MKLTSILNSLDRLWHGKLLKCQSCKHKWQISQHIFLVVSVLIQFLKRLMNSKSKSLDHGNSGVRVIRL